AGSQSGSDRPRPGSFRTNVWPQCTQGLALVLVLLAIPRRLRSTATNRCWIQTERASNRRFANQLTCNSKAAWCAATNNYFTKLNKPSPTVAIVAGRRDRLPFQRYRNDNRSPGEKSAPHNEIDCSA